MDKLNNSEDAKRLLKGLGLSIDEAVVRQVVNVLSGKVHKSLYSLYATRPDKPAPVCGKGSVYKIKKLYDKGDLRPYLAYLSQWTTVDEAEAEQVKETDHESDNIIYGELTLTKNEIHVLNEYRLELTTGVSEYDVPVPTRPVFQELCLKRIVQVQQRRTYSGPHQYDQSYWIFTDFGKECIQYLEKMNK